MPKQTRPGRILLVQDRPQSLEHQRQMFDKAAAELGGSVEIETFDLRYPPRRLVDRLQSGEWYDWMVSDLIEDGVDQSPSQCAGVRLIGALVDKGAFHGYQKLAEMKKPAGVRNLAICSVLVGDGSTPDAELMKKLDELGTNSDWFAPGGNVLPLARRICESLQLEGALAPAKGN